MRQGSRYSPTVEAESRSVVAWRIERLLAAGFDGDAAARIGSDWGFDLHALLELVDRGCPPVLAVRIVAPLEGGSSPC